MEKVIYTKAQYEEAKKFLASHHAVIVRSFGSPTLRCATYLLDNGEKWQENESLLEAPEDDYSLFKAVKDD